MGYGRFLVKKAISYFLVLFATMTILYLFTYPVIQQVIKSSANYIGIEAKRTILASHPGLPPDQVNQEVQKLVQDYLNAYGVNKPFILQYFLQMKQLISLNFGIAYYLNSPSGSNQVNQIIAAYLPNTILLFTTGTILVVALGTIIGLFAARYAGSVWDRVVPAIAVIHSSLPSWWIGFLLIAALAYAVRLFPPGGITSIPPPKEPLLYAASVIYHMILPLLAFMIVNVGGFAYVIRSIVISVMGEDFITALRARGMPESRILFRHVLRTASPAIATQVILAITGSLAGSLTLEVVFLWPGVGLLTYNAILANDVPVIMGVTYVLTIVLLLGLFLGEAVQGLLDPRIKVGE